MTRLIDADALKKAMDKKALAKSNGGMIFIESIKQIIDNSPTVEPEKIAVANVTFDKEQLEEIVEKAKTALYAEVLVDNGRPQGGWVRKEDVIYSIAKQYTEHNEVVPNWLSIGDMKGGAE